VIATATLLLLATAAAPPPPTASTAAEAAYQFVRGRAAAAEGDFREALADYAAAVELTPDEPYLRLEYARLLAQLAHFSRSTDQRHQRFTLATAQLDASRRLAGEDLEVEREAGLLYLEVAEDQPEALVAAKEALEKVRQGRPDDPQVLVSLAQIYRSEGRIDEAVEAIRHAVDTVPGNAWATSMLGRFVIEQVQQRLHEGRFEEAEGELKEVLGIDPGNRDARTSLAELEARRGAHADAAETLRGLVAEGGDPDLRPRLIWELYQSGAVAEATDDLAALVAEKPEASAVAGAVARELVGQDKEPEALALLAGLIERSEGASAPPAAGLRLELAELQAAAERWPEVTKLLAPLAALDPATPPPGAAGWRLLYSDALVELKRGEEALSLLPESVAGAAVGPDAARALVAKRGEVLLRLGREEEGKKVLEGLAGDGETESLRQAARAYQRLERYADAIPLLEQWLRADPDAVEARYFLGASYERSGRQDDAASEFRAVLDKEPDFAPALNYLGYMWAERGENLDEALSLVHRAVDLDPDNGAYVDSLGWTQYQRGQYQEARTLLERASQLLPGDATVYEHLGDVYLALGQQAQAVDVYRRSLALGEQNAEAVRRKLESLGALPDGQQ
jgi:tetratricopeptide (TPR) repeat protein